MLVKILSGIPGAVKESEQDEQRATRKQSAAFPTIVFGKCGFSELASEEIATKSPGLSDQNNDEQRSGGIGENARPSDRIEWTMRESHIVDQEDADRQQCSTCNKEQCQSLLCFFAKENERLD